MGASEAASAGKLAQSVEEYLARTSGRRLCSKTGACSSICAARATRSSESHGRCLLQFWSDERNLMRTVVEVRQRAQSLRLMTRRMGALQAAGIWNSFPPAIAVPQPRETPARRNYQHLLERALTRAFIGSKVDRLRSAMDLEHSFGPAYVRGRLLRGTCGGSGDRCERSRIGLHHRWRSHAGHSLARLLSPGCTRRKDAVILAASK